MSAIDLVSAGTERPDDLSALSAVPAEDVVALVAKTEGNGCVNDFSRMLAARAFEARLPPDAVTVFSGGTEGVLSPHVNVFFRATEAGGPPGGLVAGVGRTPPIPAVGLGREDQARAVASVVSGLVAELDLLPAAVHLVLVKCPLLTSAAIEACRAEGGEPVTSSADASMGRSRAASALGVAVALGELAEADLGPALAGKVPAYSSVASVSSGAELEDCHVLVVGTSERAAGPLGAKHAVMADALDLESVAGLLEAVAAEGGEVVQVFAKAEADPTGSIRGRRHTMLSDSDLQATRHARAAVGGLLSGLVGHSAIYVSGGAEHQGPPGGGPVTVVYRRKGSRRGTEGSRE